MAVESALRPGGVPAYYPFQAHHSTKFGASVLLGLLLSFAAGCIPLIPEDEFLSRANDFALSPELTCEQLRVEFGVPDLATVNELRTLGGRIERSPVRRISTGLRHSDEPSRTWRDTFYNVAIVGVQKHICTAEVFALRVGRLSYV